MVAVKTDLDQEYRFGLNRQSSKATALTEISRSQSARFLESSNLVYLDNNLLTRNVFNYATILAAADSCLFVSTKSNLFKYDER